MGLTCGRECMTKPACLNRTKIGNNQSVRVVTKYAKLDHLDQLLQVHRNKQDALLEMSVEDVEALHNIKNDGQLSIDNWRYILIKDYVFRKSGVTTTELMQALREIAHSSNNNLADGEQSSDNDSIIDFEDVVNDTELFLSAEQFRNRFNYFIKLLIHYQELRIERIEEQRIPLQREVKELAIINRDLFEKMDYEGKGYITRDDLHMLSNDSDSQEFFMEIFNLLDDTGCGMVTREKFDQNLTIENITNISDRLFQRKMEVQRFRYLFNM